MIDCIGIHKHYGNVEVLRGIDASFAAGEVVAIVGKSGAGKTTLLHILGTLDRPDTGQIRYGDRDLAEYSDKALSVFRNQEIGFIFQAHHLLVEFTALENAMLPALFNGTAKSEALQEAKRLLAYLGLGHRLEHRPSELSGGEQQRVAIARALINRPRVILADEPTGNLDSATSSEIHDLIFKLRDDFSQTFIIVTHNTELAARCDRILTMADGQIVTVS